MAPQVVFTANALSSATESSICLRHGDRPAIEVAADDVKDVMAMARIAG